MDNPVFYLLIIIGSVITITGIILFAKRVGADQSSKIQVFGANFENKGSSIIIFLVGAIFILIGVVYYDDPSLKNPIRPSENLPPYVDQLQPSDSTLQVDPITSNDSTVQENSTP